MRWIGFWCVASLAAAGTCGCGGSGVRAPDADASPADADASGDSRAAGDAAPRESGALSCSFPLPADFVCAKPKRKVGSRACTDAMLDQLLPCLADFSATVCTRPPAALEACNTCLFETWIEGNYLALDQCVAVVDPTSPCADTVACTQECSTFVCSVDECSTEPGSGRTPATSEFRNCVDDARSRGTRARPKGDCYDIAAKDFGTCASDPKLAVCFSTTSFYRGACRDGGNWTLAAERLDGADAGGDAADAADTRSDAQGDAPSTDVGSETDAPAADGG